VKKLRILMGSKQGLYMEPVVAESWKQHMKLGKKARELQSVAKEPEEREREQERERESQTGSSQRRCQSGERAATAIGNDGSYPRCAAS
jgi:hypothetical protein